MHGVVSVRDLLAEYGVCPSVITGTQRLVSSLRSSRHDGVGVFRSPSGEGAEGVCRQVRKVTRHDKNPRRHGRSESSIDPSEWTNAADPVGYNSHAVGKRDVVGSGPPAKDDCIAEQRERVMDVQCHRAPVDALHGLVASEAAALPSG